MRLLLATAAGWTAFEIVRRKGAQPARWGVVTALMLWQPRVFVPAAAALLLLQWKRRLAARRSEVAAAASDVALLAELCAVGLSAGLSFHAALDAAAGEVHPLLEAEIRGVLRAARRDGLAVALGRATGFADQLYRAAARASMTGAPLLPAVDAFVAERRHIERTDREAAARRLPVRLLVPLALLILPGFVLLTVGPALLTALERLEL